MTFRVLYVLRRELFDHVVVFNDRYLLRLHRTYVTYRHNDCTHLNQFSLRVAAAQEQEDTWLQESGAGDSETDFKFTVLGSLTVEPSLTRPAGSPRTLWRAADRG